MSEEADVYSRVAKKLQMTRTQAKTAVTNAICGGDGDLAEEALTAVVETKHAEPRCYFDDVDGAKFCVFAGQDETVTLGLGMTILDAWRDAARNVLRPPVPPRVQHGSPTMSLKSDEQFWKKDRAS